MAASNGRIYRSTALISQTWRPFLGTVKVPPSRGWPRSRGHRSGNANGTYNAFALFSNLEVSLEDFTSVEETVRVVLGRSLA